MQALIVNRKCRKRVLVPYQNRKNPEQCMDMTSYLRQTLAQLLAAASPKRLVMASVHIDRCLVRLRNIVHRIAVLIRYGGMLAKLRGRVTCLGGLLFLSLCDLPTHSGKDVFAGGSEGGWSSLPTGGRATHCCSL